MDCGVVGCVIKLLIYYKIGDCMWYKLFEDYLVKRFLYKGNYFDKNYLF